MKRSDEHITIREAAPADAEQLCTWWNDGRIMAHAGFPLGLGTTPDAIRHKIETDSNCRHMILYDDIPIGEMNYRETEPGVCEIGIKICDASMQNRGLGKQILSIFIEGLFDECGYRKIILDTNLKNLRARHVYERLGFRKLRICENSWKDQLGELQSSVEYDLTRDRFVSFAVPAEQDTLLLCRLSPAYTEQIEAYRKAFSTDKMRVTYHTDRIPGLDYLENYPTAAEWLAFCETMKDKISWYMTLRQRDGKIVGFCTLRHKLEYDDDDPDFASHIGYSICPSERRKGYGKRQLRLVLAEAEKLGINTVRIVCRDCNEASSRTILACGGKYIDSLYGEESGMTINRYDVPVNERKR